MRIQKQGWVIGVWSLGLLLLGVALWQTQGARAVRLASFEREPEGIMGTSCRLLVILDYRESERAQKILDKAEFQLRYIESLASNWIEASELSRFNRAEPGEHALSKVNWEILRASQQAYMRTGGAFDVTCRPLIDLWARAGERGELPSDEALAEARAQSSWEALELDAERPVATKHSGTLSVDLGGIAKGYAIDVAMEAMIAQGVDGALVDVGGDVRVFGDSARPSGAWRFWIKAPEQQGEPTEFEWLGSGAVCTSGDYARYRVIGGQRYSHIVDPVSGYPTRRVPSVTVIAPTALQADVWATALSVLGKDGLDRLPSGVEALVLMREREGTDTAVASTDGFPLVQKGSR